MKTTTRSRVLAWLLTIAMVLTMVPTMAFAVESANYTKITTADELVTGEYVMVLDNGYAPDVLEDTWVLPNQPTITETTITGSAWTITVTEAGVKLTDSNGATIAPKGGNANGIIAGDYEWAVSCTDGKFQFAGVGADTVKLASNAVTTGSAPGNNRFRAYKTTTIAGNPNNFPCDFNLYKIEAGAVVDPTEPEPTEEPTEAPTEPEAEYVPISTALAGTDGETFTVKGVVTLVDGSNLYLQDETGGICIRMSTAPTDVALGDTVIGTGTRAVYRGMVQLGSATYTKSSGLLLTAKETTIDALTDADVCTYVQILGLEVTEIYDNNGAYTSPNVTATDGTNSIQIYKAVVGKTDGTNWDIQVGDVINVKAAVGTNNGTLQLRNTLAEEITKASQIPTDPTDPTEEPTEAPTEPEPTEPEIEYVAISEALAGADGTSFTVKGVVTLVDSKNIYVQDDTGAICVRMSATPTDISLGDTIIGTGSRATYNGLPQLGSGTYVKSEGLTLTAKPVTILGLTQADICAYVKLSGVEVTEVYDSNGTYTSPNVTVKDADGNTIQIYKAVVAKNEDGTWAIQVGDKIDVKAAVSVYNTNYQLRNTLTTEITPARENGIVTDLTTLQDGDTIVIFNPANLKALSTSYSGYYNNGVDVTVNDGVLAGYTDAEIWTLGINEDGTYTFSTADGKKLSMGASYSSTPLDDVNTAWEITAAATADCVYIKNAARGSYLEWYADKGSWSSYTNIGSNEALFAQQIYLVTDAGSGSTSGSLPTDGEMVMLYNLSAEGVLALMEGDPTDPSSCVINNAAATIEEDGNVTSANGGLVFKVEINGEYYRFYNETYGYLCSTGTGNNAFYSLEASDDADWTVTSGKSGGFFLESRTAKYNGQYSQYLEYYAEAYKTYSMYNVTDYDIYEFFFYPCGNEQLTGGVVNEPAFVYGEVENAYVGKEYTFQFTVDAVFGVESVGANHTIEVDENNIYTVTIPVELVVGESLTILLSGKDTTGIEFSDEIVVTVLDEPLIDEVTPAPNAQTGDEKKPVISATVINVGENPTVSMTINDEEVTATYADGVVSYTPAADMVDGRVTVILTVTRADGKVATKTWSFTIGKATFQLYFGQLHSHTTYSDGSGSLESALGYIASLDESANVDFVAFTDHSNYFDGANFGGTANPEGALYDMSLANATSQARWAEYVGAMRDFNASQGDVIAVPGFEMTWSGGPGHINTFVTPGIVSRNNTTLNNKTADAGMKAYYALLSQAEGVDSISQFNHPGSTFGTFTDFSYWDAVLDTRIFLVEVGNGEGQVGAGGYYPSYEYYTMALDKGWHVAPTNNQDNHKGKWGNANDARDVILTDDFSEEGLYAAIRQYRVYATEDKNLEILYTVNDMVMGSIIEEVPEALNINVQVYDPDKSDSISKVEVIVNSGKVAYTWDDPAVLSVGELTCTISPDYSYYYIRVTEGDGDLAVTAPVWVGETLKLGISAVECGTSTPVTNEELTITTTLFNSEAVEATVKSITYTTNGSQVLDSDTTGYTVPASGTLAIDWAYTPTVAKVMKITATVVMEMEGIEYEFSMDVELDVLDADELVYIGIDASHYNEYVAGNYKDSMGNFGQLAAGYSVRTVELKTSEELIAACENENGKFKAIILTAPSRRLAAAQADPRVYSDDELAALKAFNKAGGMVILAGWSDNYENYDAIINNPDIIHMAETQNTILEALGSSLRITDDATHDDTYNGGQTQRLYFNSYNFDSFLMDRVEVDPENPHDRMYTEVYSQYGGATIHVVDASGAATSTVPATVTPIVFGHAGTYSKDTDNDGIGGDSVPKYTYAEGDDRLLVLASEEIEGQGMIIVSGAAFMSNFEVQATIEDSGAEKNYSNYKICENLVQYLNPVKLTDIAEVSAQAEVGYKYTIEGVVTSNASGYDKDTAFFDCIYVQDATGGICCFPVAGSYKIGDVVRVTGTTEFYQGEPELQVTSITVIGEAEPVAPTVITAQQLNSREVEGMLVTVSGVVKSYEIANGLIQTIMVEDAEGNVARVFIDGYITTANEVQGIQLGCLITATGLASYDDTFNAPEGPFPRIRVRDRADIVCTENPDAPLPFVDVTKDRWFYEYVEYVYTRGLMKGMEETLFGPNNMLTREQIVTILYRMAGSPAVTGENPFSDVPAGKYYTDAVIWASQNGITKGKSDTIFMPKANVTRQELVAFLHRYAQYMGLDVSVDPSITLDGFVDVDDVSSYAMESMTWAYANGLISGMGNNNIAPQDTASRAQVAKLITVLDQLLNK